MGISKDTKLRWFDLGAAAFERTFPGLLAERLGSTWGPGYVCPQCDRVFRREAVTIGILTAEHVPPDSFGGREWLLTCRWCNNDAGTRMDAHARKKENIAALLVDHDANIETGITLEHQGRSVNALLTTDSKTFKIEIGKDHNAQTGWTEFKNAGFSPDHDFRLGFNRDRFSPLAEQLSWLRSGFLAMVAVYGYRFSFDPAIRIVKRQLANLNTPLIPSFRIEIPKTLEWQDWRLLQIAEPRCRAILFGRYAILFPYDGDLTFYDRVAERLRAQQEGKVPTTATAQAGVIGGRDPLFGYDEGSLLPPSPSVAT